MNTKREILQHKLLSKMEGYNDEMKPEPTVGPKVKALTVIVSVILATTLGVYYMGKLNIIGVDLSHKGELDMFDTYMLGILNTLLSILILIVLTLLCFSFYSLYNRLVDSFSK